jgi:enterochelin esterase family protein
MIRRRAGWDRKGEPKPIRVYLQDGSNDLDNAAGSWPIANQDMAAALRYGNYDFTFRMGQGFHSDKHGRALLPEAMRWLWRDEPK